MRRLLVQVVLSCLLLSVVIGCDKTPTKPEKTPDAPAGQVEKKNNMKATLPGGGGAPQPGQ